MMKLNDENKEIGFDEFNLTFLSSELKSELAGKGGQFDPTS